MSRYFLEVAYRGTNYSGFQVQGNANTIQSEIEKSFKILHRKEISLTGSSRTDAGVHALQNYFHFDFEESIHPQFIYKMNALLPEDMVIREGYIMSDEAHCRFDATSREYVYRIHRFKNPFLKDVSYFYPYKLDLEIMNQGAAMLLNETNFFAFSKTNTQVKNFNCTIKFSQWMNQNEELVFHIEANRFLRGMVRLITASLLKLGRNTLTLEQFQKLFKGSNKSGYSIPAHGLFLKKVNYPQNYFPLSILRSQA